MYVFNIAICHITISMNLVVHYSFVTTFWVMADNLWIFILSIREHVFFMIMLMPGLHVVFNHVNAAHVTKLIAGVHPVGWIWAHVAYMYIAIFEGSHICSHFYYFHLELCSLPPIMNLNEVESTWIKFNQFQFAQFCWHFCCMHMWTQLYIRPWYRCWVKVRFNSCSFHIIQISMNIFPSFCCLNWIELLNSRVGWSSGQVYAWNVSRLSTFEILSW